MEPQPALVGAKRGIVLHAKAAIDMDLALVIGPWHAKDYLALGLAQPVNQPMFEIAGMFGDHASQAFHHFAERLMKFGFAGVAL